MRRWWTVLIILGLSLGLAAALQAGGVSCITRWDAAFQRYVTRCADGRQYKSTYDKSFDRYRTTPMPPWKPLDKSRK